MKSCRFLKDESGAVATDWVVVTAGIVGLGLATITVVSAGVENQSNDIANWLANASFFRNAMTVVGSFDFTDGNMAGWIGGQVIDMGGQLGELLVLGPGQATNYLMEVPPGTQLATMTFDLIGGDSLDNSAQWGFDTGTMMINGVPVAIATNNGNQGITLQIPQVDGTTVEAVVTVNAEHLGGRNNWTDAVANVTVEVSQPTADLQFEFVSNANQGINDEFWGIDNFEAGVSGAPGF
jgi:Flp pilus assembly pilin Flp